MTRMGKGLAERREGKAQHAHESMDRQPIQNGDLVVGSGRVKSGREME